MSARGPGLRASRPVVAVVAPWRSISSPRPRPRRPRARRAGRPVAGIDIVRVTNRGIAFGLLDDAGSLVLVIAAVAFAALLGVFLASAERPGLWLPIGLLAGGALGNLIDRIREGAVTDFIDPPRWPAFNLADVEITIGVVLLVWIYAFGPRPGRSRVRRVEAGRCRPGVGVSATRRPLVAWSDEHLAVVDKPAGLLVHPAPGNHRPDARRRARRACSAAVRTRQRPGIVHRLDRDTSGLLVVARTPEAHTALSAMIAAREVSRAVRGARRGLPASRTGKIDARSAAITALRSGSSVGGRRPRPAVTHFEVRERLARDALARRPPRDGPHPPDPRPPAGDRPSDRR